MATPILRPVSKGETTMQKQKGMQNNKTNMRKGSANAAGARGEAASGEVEAEADEPDSSANDEMPDDETNEMDAFALSGAQKWDMMNGGKRLAGLGEDDMQAVAGASADDEYDDDYTGVADVSDGEETEDVHEQNLMRAAEQDLIAEFERTRREPEPEQSSFNFDINMDDDPFGGFTFGNTMYEQMYEDADKTFKRWGQQEGARGTQNTEDLFDTKKRVRFEEPTETRSRSPSASSSEDPNELFPDLFDTAGDPALVQQFGLDVDVDAAFDVDYDDAASCYDFDGEEERLALELDDESSESEDDEDDDEDDLSDLDSEDEGDTTDEETEEQTIARVKELQRLAAERRKSAPNTPTPTKRATVPARARTTTSPTTPKTGKGPKMGTFIIDKSRATMSADATGKRVMVRPPTRPAENEKAFWERAKMAARSRSSTPRTPSLDDMPRRPFTAKSTLFNMFDGNLDILRNNDEMGIAQDLFPSLVPRHSSLSTDTLAEDSEPEVKDLDMQEFIDMDDSDSDIDRPQSSSSIMSPTQSELCDSFSSLDARRNDSLLDHLDRQRGLVGSFRNNQNVVKHVSSLPAHPASRASASEHNALQKGRRAAANTPITPARKKRVSQDLNLTGAGVRKAISSPLAGRRPRSRGGSLSGNLHQTLGPDLMK